MRSSGRNHGLLTSEVEDGFRRMLGDVLNDLAPFICEELELQEK